ncbi:TraB/GumN family protein [Danxiaibacter flavus]|uniref:TraB/GumN family protein n=1 Tax=Danxiaibacter flavus TaxID=3049108 RepID=A0ABV3ZCR1_9BACT|nr:TraB/GumN family protein [Chitinophagaceae bacterium DXS]
MCYSINKKLLNFLVTGITSLLFYTASSAQTTTYSSLLWEVSGNGLQQPSYLYGTFHLVCPDDLVISPVISGKIQSSKKLFLEMDMDDPSVMIKVQQGMMLTDSSWKDLLSEKEYNALADSFQKITQMPIGMMTRIKPFALVSIITMGIMKCPMASWDLALAQKAKDNNIEIKGLESPERELEAINMISLKDQTDMLKDMLLNADSCKKAMDKMMDMYKRRDLKGLTEEIKNDKSFGMLEDELLDKRNAEWAPVIEKQITTEPTFFAFGAGHLVGDSGIISLLKKRGYTVKPVKY